MCLVRQGKLPDAPPALRAYCAAVTLMARSRHYGIILEVVSYNIFYSSFSMILKTQITLFALEHAMSNEALSAVLQTLGQHVEVWGCLNRMKTIAEALYSTHNFWKTRGVQSRDLLGLLFAINNDVHLDQAAREQLMADHANFTRVSVIFLSYFYY